MPHLQNGPAFPHSWQDTWIMGLSDEAWILTSNSLEYLDTTFGIVETTTFLDTWSLITADKIKRCHTCHVIKELHPNVLQLHASDCKSQVCIFLMDTEILIYNVLEKTRYFLYIFFRFHHKCYAVWLEIRKLNIYSGKIYWQIHNVQKYLLNGASLTILHMRNPP